VPLIRSEVALENAALALFKTLGATEHETVQADCGLEQEFFLVCACCDCNHFVLLVVVVVVVVLSRVDVNLYVLALGHTDR
jgi:glutamine synthetase type III